MIKFLTQLPATLLFMVMASCGGQSSAENTASEPASEVLPSPINEGEEVEEVVPDFSTGEKQREFMLNSENADLYVDGILPQMTEDAPEYSRAILESEGKRFIVVDKGKMKLFLYDPYGNIEKSYGIACAKNYGTKHKKGDSRTTEGCFQVKGVFDSTEWLFTDDNGYTSPTKGQYGPRFIRLNIPYIGIHGTGSPGSIGRRCSHGCIRVTNANIMELVEFVEPGMTVIISPGPRDMAVNEREGYNIPSVMTEPGGTKSTAAKETHKEPEKKETENVTEEIPDTMKAVAEPYEIVFPEEKGETQQNEIILIESEEPQNIE